MFRNLRCYRVTSPWPESEEALSEILSGNAFTPCGSFSERSAGWEALGNNEGDPLCRRLNGADLIQLRTQSRVLPAAAIKEVLAPDSDFESLLFDLIGAPHADRILDIHREFDGILEAGVFPR